MHRSKLAMVWGLGALAPSLAVAPAVAPALAQSINIDTSDLPAPGDTITITMTAGYGGTDWAVAGIGTSLVIPAPAGAAVLLGGLAMAGRRRR